MAIRFDCPSCKTNYEVADDLGGKMIMCRVCQKRGPVRSLTGTPAPSTVLSSAALASRRKFLLVGSGVLASLGAVATGAVLAQWRPWRKWGDRPPGGPGGPGGPPGGRRRGPPEDGKDRPAQGSRQKAGRLTTMCGAATVRASGQNRRDKPGGSP